MITSFKNSLSQLKKQPGFIIDTGKIKDLTVLNWITLSSRLPSHDSLEKNLLSAEIKFESIYSARFPTWENQSDAIEKTIYTNFPEIIKILQSNDTRKITQLNTAIKNEIARLKDHPPFSTLLKNLEKALANYQKADPKPALTPQPKPSSQKEQILAFINSCGVKTSEIFFKSKSTPELIQMYPWAKDFFKK